MTTVDTQWSPFLTKALADAIAHGIPRYDLPEHKHWEWERKARSMNADSLAFAIEAGNETQGLMILRMDKTGRLPEQLGKPLVYVDYLATAPWNLPELVQIPRLRKSGTRLLEAAIRYSEDNGFDGRVGLHALQQAESFYRDQFHMQDLGIDYNYEDLRYFELAGTSGKASI